MTKSDVQKGPENPGFPVRHFSPVKKTAGSTPAKTRLIADIGRILDSLDEAGLSQVLDAAKICRYEMELERKEAERRTTMNELPVGESGVIRIERSEDGATYHLIVGRVWKIFAAEEIASLLGIARHAESESAAARRLYHWLLQERRDITSDLDIRSAASELLLEILRLLRETFPVKTPRRLP